MIKRLHHSKYKLYNMSLLADESTNLLTFEELSLVVCWLNDGLPLENFIEVVLRS